MLPANINNPHANNIELSNLQWPNIEHMVAATSNNSPKHPKGAHILQINQKKIDQYFDKPVNLFTFNLIENFGTGKVFSINVCTSFLIRIEV